MGQEIRTGEIKNTHKFSVGKPERRGTFENLGKVETLKKM